MILKFMCICYQRQQKHLVITSTRHFTQKLSLSKRAKALKLWKLWPITYFIKEKPKPVILTYFGKITESIGGIEGVRTLSEKGAGVVFVLLALFGVFYFTHIIDTPLTHRKRFILFNNALLEEVSDEVFKNYVINHRDTIVSGENQNYQRVERVANKIVHSNLDIPEMVHKDWSVTIVNEPSFNVFALPTGQILVYEGMLSICKTDDQLAAVLGHEFAHVILGHTAELANNLNMWNKLWMTGAMVFWSLMPNMHQTVSHYLAGRMSALFLNLPYNQLLEQEADKIGLEMLAKACFDVRESSAFWARMEAIQAMNFDDRVEWLYVHPDFNRHRSKTVDSFLPEALKIRLKNKCAPLPNHDPREDISLFRKEFEDRLAHQPKAIIGQFGHLKLKRSFKHEIDEEKGEVDEEPISHKFINAVKDYSEQAKVAINAAISGEKIENSPKKTVRHKIKKDAKVIDKGSEIKMTGKSDVVQEPHVHQHQHGHKHTRSVEIESEKTLFEYPTAVATDQEYTHAPDQSAEPGESHEHALDHENAPNIEGGMYNHDDHYHRSNDRTPVDKKL